MPKIGIHICLFLMLLASATINAQNALNEGLYFYAEERNKDKRTSLDLTPDAPLKFKKGFSIEFTAKFREGDGYYGNILNVIGDNKFNINLLANVDPSYGSGKANFWLSVQDSIVSSFGWSSIPKGDFNKWMKFKLQIDLVEPTLILSIDGERIAKYHEGAVDLSDFEIVFGKSDNPQFLTTDVSPMSIKNVKIRDHNDQLVRHWVLGRHTNGNRVYDEIENDVALVTNPNWLIDQHLFWNKENELTFKKLIGSAIDNMGERIFFVDAEAVYVYSTLKMTVDTLRYTGSPFPCWENTLIYNSHSNELWSYSLEQNGISKFDFSTSGWSLDANECSEPNFWHHNKVISPKDSSVVTFGGYGFFSYKNDIKKLKDKSSGWNTINSNNLPEPRYLSSLGVLDRDKFLIFGGYGNKSGVQMANPHNYYDLYSVGFDNFEVNRLWQVESPEYSPFAPVSSMVVNPNLNSFYTLIFQNTQFDTDLRLARFGINEYEMVVFPDSIPYEFNDVSSNAGVFLNEKQSRLFSFVTVDNTASLYSLAYPPLQSSEVFQEEKVSKTLSSNLLWVIVIGSITAGIAIIYFLVNYRRRKSKAHAKDHIEEIVLKPFNREIDKKTTSAIYVFGGLQVYDKKGSDITGMFTPTLKQLFLLILLSGIKNEKGISSIKLTEILWYDKSENRARNNRNVNISKLRMLLEKIGNVELHNENTYWKIELKDEVYCDYCYVSNKLNRMAVTLFEEDELQPLINALSAGEICPDIHTEWMDNFKVDISDRVIDGLERFSKSTDNLNLHVLIGTTILKYAPLNEEAILMKCRALYLMGNKGLAKKHYDRFCAEYMSLLDSKYEVSFSEVVG